MLRLLVIAAIRVGSYLRAAKHLLIAASCSNMLIMSCLVHKGQAKQPCTRPISRWSALLGQAAELPLMLFDAGENSGNGIRCGWLACWVIEAAGLSTDRIAIADFLRSQPADHTRQLSLSYHGWSLCPAALADHAAFHQRTWRAMRARFWLQAPRHRMSPELRHWRCCGGVPPGDDDRLQARAPARSLIRDAGCFRLCLNSAC